MRLSARTRLILAPFPERLGRCEPDRMKMSAQMVRVNPIVATWPRMSHSIGKASKKHLRVREASR